MRRINFHYSSSCYPRGDSPFLPEIFSYSLNMSFYCLPLVSITYFCPMKKDTAHHTAKNKKSGTEVPKAEANTGYKNMIRAAAAQLARVVIGTYLGSKI